MKPLSVVLCTYNPDKRLLGLALRAIARQQSDASELIVIDNASDPPLANSIFAANGLSIGRVIKEPRPGLSFARATGIKHATSELIVFVDDDNELQKDYFVESVSFSEAHPEVGAFAGRATGIFERQPDWLIRRHIARYAIRDLGDQPLVGSGKSWGPHEPFGAGLVVRRDVAMQFAKLVDLTSNAGGLGRAGETLASGEDSLFSRIADRLGYQVAYAPSLRLDHHIGADRMKWRYLFRLIAGQAHAQVALDRICGRADKSAPPPLWREPDLLTRRFLGRLRDPGLHEAISHVAWDRAYWAAQRTPPGASETYMATELDKL